MLHHLPECTERYFETIDFVNIEIEFLAENAACIFPFRLHDLVLKITPHNILINIYIRVFPKKHKSDISDIFVQN